MNKEPNVSLSLLLLKFENEIKTKHLEIFTKKLLMCCEFFLKIFVSCQNICLVLTNEVSKEKA